MARARTSSRNTTARTRRAGMRVRNVGSFERAQLYEQKVSGGELYFMPLDLLKNGAWRGLLVRRYARAERAIKTTLGRIEARLWTHVAKVPAEVERRFGDAGNLGTMSPSRNRRRNGTAAWNFPTLIRSAKSSLADAKRERDAEIRAQVLAHAESMAKAARAEVDTHGQALEADRVLAAVKQARTHGPAPSLTMCAKTAGKAALSRSKQALRRLAHAASKAWG